MDKDLRANRQFMQMAIQLANENVANNGGPFGAVVVKDGKVVATGVNRVTSSLDPSAHAEISAIRAACKALGSFSLEGCVIYSSCEPCPMCLSAIYWARIEKIFYAGNRFDAAEIGFDDSFLYDELALKQEERSLPSENIMHDEAQISFDLWRSKDDKTHY